MAIDIKKLISDFDYLLKKETENKFFIRKSFSEKNKEEMYLLKSSKDILLAKTIITLFETTKFHLSLISGLAVTFAAIGILCAQKPPAHKWNFERQKPRALGMAVKTCHPSLTGGF